MAVVTVLSTIAYLFLTAIPAFAASSCTYDDHGTAASDDTLTVNIGTDDHVWLLIENNNFTGPTPDQVFLVENGDTVRQCGGGTNDIDSLEFVNVTGSDAGNETLTIVNNNDGATKSFGNPAGPHSIEFTIDLGNGNDTVEVDYAGVTFNDGLTSSDDRIDDSGNNDTTELGSSNSGDWVNLEDDLNSGGPIDDDDNTANILLVDAENLVINGGEGHDDTDVETSNFQFADFNGNDVRGPFNHSYVFNGGSGNDLAEFSAADATFNGGPGDDEADFQDHPGGVTVDLSTGTATGSNYVLTDVQDVVGTVFDDVLTGSSLDNDIDGLQGNDIINGLGGNDGAGADNVGISNGLQGGGGNDEIFDGPGNDLADGGANNDIMHQDATANGTDVLDDSGGGLDTLDYSLRTTSTVINETSNVCGQDVNADGDATDTGDEQDSCSGYDILVTGSANDTLVGDGSGELFLPGLGDDHVSGNAGTDVLDISAGGAANINLQTGIATGEGTDTISSIEQFVTGAGDDVLIPRSGSNIDPATSTFDWFADGGIDTIDASSTTIGVTADLSNMGATTGGGFFTPACAFGGGGLANGTCTDVENAIGGAGDDRFGGTLIDNNLDGQGGNDTLIAGSGNDFLHGGDGSDTMDGQAGSDTTSYRDATGGVEIDNQAIFGGGATGAAGSDTYVTGFETVLMSDFNDIFRGGQTFLDANLKVLGFLGNDEITGSNSVDLLRGGKGNDLVRGGLGDDNLRGSGGDDVLVGEAGSDILLGGSGSDIGRGGRGFDHCSGVEFENSC